MERWPSRQDLFVKTDRGASHLENVTQGLKLAVHHIGGRGGTRRFPALERFESGIVNVLYEADVSAINGIQMATSRQSSEQCLLPVCVTSGAKRVTLHKVYNAGASSTLPVDPRFPRQLPWLGEGVIDYDLHAWSSLGSDELRGRSLDEILLDRASPAPLPDFLSINTQGTEAEIVSGGAISLSESCLALLCEVSFLPIYEG